MELLREGRAALATSFSCFKFMALYSMIQFTTLTLMYIFRTSLTDGQFIYVDVMLIIPFGILLSRFGPADIVNPIQPTARLISAPVLSSIIGHVLLQFLVQFSVAVLVASKFSFSNLTSQIPSRTGNMALFLTSVFLYSTVALVFSFGHPHRQRFFLPFTVFLLFTFVLAVFLCLVRVDRLDWFLSLEGLSPVDGLAYLVSGGAHLVSAVIYEMGFVPWLTKAIKMRGSRRRIPV
jgi:cation-transporting ATPase 13A3/4/5